MNELPPQHEKIVFIREYIQRNEAKIERSIWQEVEHQMSISHTTLETFVNRALQYYVAELKERQEKDREYLDYNEYQLFKSTLIPICPYPAWYYHLEEDKK